MWGKYPIFMYILIIFPELSFSFLILTEIQRNKIKVRPGGTGLTQG